MDEEKQQQQELEAIRGEASDGEEDIDKIEAKLEEDIVEEETSSESEEELEDDVVIKDKPRKHNPMIADEAEESDCDEIPNDEVGNEGNEADDNDEESESSEESEDEQPNSTKKGRILKAFEDSDDEDASPKLGHESEAKENVNDNGDSETVAKEGNADVAVIKDTQGEEKSYNLYIYLSCTSFISLFTFWNNYLRRNINNESIK